MLSCLLCCLGTGVFQICESVVYSSSRGGYELLYLVHRLNNLSQSLICGSCLALVVYEGLVVVVY
jgi:hypothetical protein